MQKGRNINTNCQQPDARVYTGKSVCFLSMGVLMAVLKSSDISKTGMQHSSCIHTSRSHLEMLTFCRPAIKDDQYQQTAPGNPDLYPSPFKLCIWHAVLTRAAIPMPSLAYHRQASEHLHCSIWDITCHSSLPSPFGQVVISRNCTAVNLENQWWENCTSILYTTYYSNNEETKLCRLQTTTLWSCINILRSRSYSK